jgi:hypothetical protein
MILFAFFLALFLGSLIPVHSLERARYFFLAKYYFANTETSSLFLEILVALFGTTPSLDSSAPLLFCSPLLKLKVSSSFPAFLELAISKNLVFKMDLFKFFIFFLFFKKYI